MTRSSASRDIYYLLAVVVAVVAIASLYFARVVLIPFALALLFTFILTPVVKLLERLHFGRVFSTLLVILLAGAAFGAVGWSVARQFSEVVNELPAYKSTIKTKLESIHWSTNRTLDNASATMTEISKELSSSPQHSQSLDANQPARSATSHSARPLPVEVVKSPALPLESVQNVLGLLTSALIVLVFTIFMLIRREDLRNRLISLAGDGHLHTITQALDDASARVSRYLLTQFIINSLYGIFIGICLHFIGVPGAALWGAVAGILRFLPYVGPPLGGIVPILLSMAVFNGWSHLLITVALFVITELILSNLIEPIVYGAHTGISSLAIFVAAIFWTALWGPIGLVLSTPLTVCLLVVGRHVPQLNFLNTLLGDQPALTPDSRFYQRLLAMDHEEARGVLEDYLKEKSLEQLYDSVLIPALSLAEQDRHQNRLDDANEKFIIQSTRELVDELFEPRSANSATVATESSAPGDERDSPSPPPDESPRPARPQKILCVPARDEADEIVATMLAQVLDRTGHQAQSTPVTELPELLALIKSEKPDAVCISALPPFAVPHARSLYSKLRAQAPNLKIIIGLWNFSGDAERLNRRLGLPDGSRALTTLAEFIEELQASSAPNAASPRVPGDPVPSTS